MNDFPNEDTRRNLPVFAAAIVALVMYAPGNKENSQVASNDAGAITQPGPAFNKPETNRPAVQAPAQQ